MMPSGYPDPAEIVIASRGYSAWAMIPSFLICAVLSILFLLGGRLVEGIRGLGETTGSWILFTLTGVFWTFQLLRWLYRGASYLYVLTERRLLVDRGFRWQPTPPIELSDVTNVRWGMHYFSRPFSVGWVELTTREGRRETLRGVLNPREFAWLTETWRGKRQPSSPPATPEQVATT